MAQTTFKFGSNDSHPVTTQKRHRRQTSKSSVGSEDHSLSYSATSSVQSFSTTGESTDSSFAEIYKVLDSAEEEEMKLLEKIGGNSSTKEKHGTVTGQSSDSHGHDGGGSHGSALFVPADSNRSTPSRPSTKEKHRNSLSRRDSSQSSTGHKGKRETEKNKPPQGPIKKNDGKQIWYSQLWMCGFADAFNFSGDTQN